MQPHLFAARLRTSDPQWDQVTRRVIVVANDAREALDWGNQLSDRYIAEGHALTLIDSRLEKFCPAIPGFGANFNEHTWSRMTNDDLKNLWWCYGEPRDRDQPVALFGYVSADEQPRALKLWRDWVAENAPGYRAGDVLSTFPASCAVTTPQRRVHDWREILW